MIILFIFAGVFSVLSLYARCISAGQRSRGKERMEEQEAERLYEPVWDDDDRRHSGLLEEDEE